MRDVVVKVTYLIEREKKQWKVSRYEVDYDELRYDYDTFRMYRIFPMRLVFKMALKHFGDYLCEQDLNR